MVDYYFILVSASWCGHCKTFKEKHLDNLLNKLKSYNNVTYLNINFDNNNNEILSKYGFLSDYMAAFPNMILITKDSFNNKNINGIVFYVHKKIGVNNDGSSKLQNNPIVTGIDADKLIGYIEKYLTVGSNKSATSESAAASASTATANRILPQYRPNLNNPTIGTYRLILTSEDKTLINKRIPDNIAKDIMNKVNNI